MKNLYDPDYVEALFDKMSVSYARMNYLTSFGFSSRWRRGCVDQIEIKKGQSVVDLMTGMGECWPNILKKTGKEGQLIALDFSEGMLKFAYKRKLTLGSFDIEILKENVFNNSIVSNSVDVVISGFGIKTFSEEQLKNLAREIKRLLKPGGGFSLIDVSVPKSTLLSVPYLFYLKYIIPILGKLFLGNPETYKMLGVYTEKFVNARQAKKIFEAQGLETDFVEYFYGCASGIKGRKPG